MTDFFRAYDLRGKHPEQISEEEARRLGKAYGTYIESRTMVARDGRTHAEKITEAFIEGILSTGTDVLSIGMVPSPVLYFAVDDREFSNGAVVTASHNPPEYTGFKFCLDEGLAMSRENGMKDIQEIYEKMDFDEGNGGLEEKNVEEDYMEAVSELFEVNIEIAVNYGNGVTAELAPELLEKIGCEVTNVNEEIDGNFPNHLPNPTDEEAQKALKQEMSDEDLGVIFDGDGDRAGFIYEGEYISEDKVIALFSQRILEDEIGKVVHDLRCSKLVKEKVKEFGGEPVESRVGHTFISENIHDDPEVVFAGELSGHYYFPSLGFPWDDGILAACLMCDIADKGEIERLKAYPDYPVSSELRIDCPEERKSKVIEGLKEKFSDRDLTTKDGVKIEFEEGWALVRPSNTEEKMSVRCEASTEEDLEKILGSVESTVRSLC